MSWQALINNWKSMGLPTRRRQSATGRGIGWCGEVLEQRALLSATGLITPEAAEFARVEKASFEPPNVNGSWTVSVGGQIPDVVTFNQNGTKVSGTLVLPVVGNVGFSGKFTKKNPHEISDKFKIKDPELGKITIQVEINFPEVERPTQFTGKVEIEGKNLVGEPGTLSLAANRNSVEISTLGSKAAVQFADVSGLWEVILAGGPINQPLDIRFTQSGGGDRKVTGKSIDQAIDAGDSNTPNPIPPTPVITCSLKGKFDKASPQDVNGKAVVQLEDGQKIKAKFQITYDDLFEEFVGLATSKSFGSITLVGTKALIVK